MIRIVLTSDNHLNRYYAKMSREQLRLRRKRIRDAWRETIDFAIARRAHFYLHAGDLFDQPNPSPVELTAVAREFQRLREAGVRVLCISGNHDMPRVASEGATPVRIYQELKAARVFTKRAEVEFDLFEIDGQHIAIGGLAPNPSASPDVDLLENITVEPPPADVTLLLMHTGVEDAVPPDFGNAILKKSRIASLPQINYFLCGDLHHANLLTVGGATVVIPGSTERLNFGEMKERAGFYYLELDGARLSKAVHEDVTPQRMARLEILTTNLPPDNPSEFLIEEIRAASHADQMLQLRLQGPVTRETYHALRWFELWRVGSERNAFFDIDRHALQVRAPSDAGSFTSGEARVSTVDELELMAGSLIEAAESESDRLLFQEARSLVLSLYREQ